MYLGARIYGNHSIAQMGLLIETFSQVSNVTHGPLILKYSNGGNEDFFSLD